MLRKSSYLLGVAACGALLASCGGGNNNPSPSPTPTGSGTPTPSPTATPTPTAVDLDFTKAFVTNSTGVYAYAYFTPNNGAEVFSDASRLTGSGGINYAVSPAKVSFTFADLEGPREFGEADLVSATETMRVYANNNAPGNKAQRLILELPFGEVLRVTYELTDDYTRETVPGTLRSRRVILFANRVTTTTAISGTLSYVGQPQVIGGKPGVTGSSAITAGERTFTVTVSGTNASLAGTIPVFENVGGTPTQRALLSFTTTNPIAANGTFSGEVKDTANNFTGAFAGSLAGPNRDEIFLIFSASHSDGRKFVGSYIGS